MGELRIPLPRFTGVWSCGVRRGVEEKEVEIESEIYLGDNRCSSKLIIRNKSCT